MRRNGATIVCSDIACVPSSTLPHPLHLSVHPSIHISTRQNTPTYSPLTNPQSNPSGENLAAGYPNVSAAVISWGAERDRYNFHRGDYSTATGHFTQLVWRATQTVGCARSFCNAGAEGGKGTAPGWFVVCEYWPGGNVIGAFGENVQPYVKVEDEAREDKDVPGMEGRGGREGVSGWTLGLGVLGALGLVW